MPVISQRSVLGPSLTPWPAEVLNADSTPLRIGLINNMPDAALEDTERQFFELLQHASRDIRVDLKLYSLPGVPRSDRARQHLDKFYLGLDELLSSDCDAVIVTGTEPHSPDLKLEPYWESLTTVFDWAEHNTSSVVLSCLAAHASVFHYDSISRRRLGEKCFGVFEERKTCEHGLMQSLPASIRIPHSRWNELSEDDLTQAGYTVLTKSAEAGVNIFVKKHSKSLFVHFQGHPEYERCTLLKEYRRDIKRFLRGERDTFPNVPAHYFSAPAVRSLGAYREKAFASRSEDLLTQFPESNLLEALQKTWEPSALTIYRNWLAYLESAKSRRAIQIEGAWLSEAPSPSLNQGLSSEA